MKGLNELIEKLRKRDRKIEVTWNPEQTEIRRLRGNLADPVNIDELRKAPHELARLFIKENKAIIGNLDETLELIDLRAMTNRRKITHVVFQQIYGTALVLGGKIAFHYDEKGYLFHVNSNLALDIEVGKKPALKFGQALDVVTEREGFKASIRQNVQPVLVVIDAKTVHQEKNTQRYYLCWRLRIVHLKESRQGDMIYIVDALKGEVLLRYSAVHTVGKGVYSQGTDLNFEEYGTSYRLRDTKTSKNWVEYQPVISTYDDEDYDGLGLHLYSEDDNKRWNNNGGNPANRFDDQGPEVDLHRFLGYVLKYFYEKHEHYSWDGKGGEVKGHAHSGRSDYMPNNAVWDSDDHELYFGDGDGVTQDFYVTLDTVAHEFTHGVISGFSVLETYCGETGALNEAIADLFGALVALGHPNDAPYPWHHGRQHDLNGQVGRNMADPSRDASGNVKYDNTNEGTKFISALDGFYPDHYDIRYKGDDDDQGVHINCTIISHAVYLIINGGMHRRSNKPVNPIGDGPIGEILYEIISSDSFDKISDFKDFRKAFIEACEELFPNKPDYLKTVNQAFDAVGII